jgi:hypothetical protein
MLLNEKKRIKTTNNNIFHAKLSYRGLKWNLKKNKIEVFNVAEIEDEIRWSLGG